MCQMTTRLLRLSIALSLGVVLSGAFGIADAQAKCPPGLAKKGSCVPPGQRKDWKRGDHLPDNVKYRIIVRTNRMPAPRPGEVYADIGGRVYLLAQATRRIVEAVNLADKAIR